MRCFFKTVPIRARVSFAPSDGDGAFSIEPLGPWLFYPELGPDGSRRHIVLARKCGPRVQDGLAADAEVLFAPMRRRQAILSRRMEKLEARIAKDTLEAGGGLADWAGLESHPQRIPKES